MNEVRAAPRDVLAWFASEMEDALRRNDHKRGWEDCSGRRLLNRLRKETRELERAIKNGDNIIREAADVANYAMMIADVERRRVIELQAALDCLRSREYDAEQD